ncbi:hypothetical protein ACW9HJ_07965 [Nocardia gipuzkoensis]
MPEHAVQFLEAGYIRVHDGRTRIHRRGIALGRHALVHQLQQSGIDRREQLRVSIGSAGEAAAVDVDYPELFCAPVRA